MENLPLIDSHQHFWVFDPIRDTWMDEATMSKIRRDFLPEDLLPIIKDNGISNTIAVQADQSEAETLFLLKMAEQHDFILGVVGWVDLLRQDLHAQLKALDHPKLLGYRHVLQGEERGFITQQNFIEGVQQVGKHGLTYDILVYAHQLDEVITLVDHCGEQPLIIDHLAKPEIKNGRIKTWEKQMRVLSSYPNIYCKISGMITEADWQTWTYNDLLPYLDVVFDAFGQDRCVFGSDWPVCTLAGEYGQVFNIVSRYLADHDLDRNAVFSRNARNFYRLV